MVRGCAVAPAALSAPRAARVMACDASAARTISLRRDSVAFVLAVAVRLAGLDRVRRMAVAAGHSHLSAKLRANGLKHRQELVLHLVAPGVLAIELGLAEVRVSPPLCGCHLFVHLLVKFVFDLIELGKQCIHL